MKQSISKLKIKKIIELHSKKGRDKYNLFFGETHKIFEFVYQNKHTCLDSIYCLESWYIENVDFFDLNKISVFILSPKELKAMSLLKNPHDLLFTMKNENNTELDQQMLDPIVLFDTIQDPGNFGTIIRTLSWFGVKQIICSPDSVSFTNPKVIQASMGAFTLVNIIYTPLKEFVLKNSQLDYYATDMVGQNIYKENTLSKKRVGLIFGNEGSGISQELLPLVTETLTIPPQNGTHPESLNLSISVGIIISQLFHK